MVRVNVKRRIVKPFRPPDSASDEVPSKSLRTNVKKSYVHRDDSDDEPLEKKNRGSTKKSSLKKNSKSRNADEKNKSEEKEYEVENIVDVRKSKGRTLYLVHWKGWSSENDTWETEANLYCPTLIREFEKNQSDNSKSRNADEKNKSEEKEYEVENIIDVRKSKGHTLYLVHWKGWSSKSDTWETESNLDCPAKIREFEKNQSDAGLKKRGRPANEQSAKKKAKKSEDSDSAEDEEYEVQKIVSFRVKRNGKKEFLVHWRGWSKNDDSWVAEEDLACDELIAEFMKEKDSGTKPVRSLRESPQKAPAKQVALEGKKSHRNRNNRATYFDQD